jgi:hypothetical protein
MASIFVRMASFYFCTASSWSEKLAVGHGQWLTMARLAVE